MLVCWRYFIVVFFDTLIFVLVTLIFYHKNNLLNTALKSIVDDFNMEPGVVSMRVVFVLRSAEIQPVFQDLSFSQEKDPPIFHE